MIKEVTLTRAWNNLKCISTKEEKEMRESEKENQEKEREAIGEDENGVHNKGIQKKFFSKFHMFRS